MKFSTAELTISGRYKSVFGELPSETARLSKTGATQS